MTVIAPARGLASAVPQSSQLFAAALRVPLYPAFLTTQLTNEEHHGVSSAVAFSVVVAWYSRIRGWCAAAPTISCTPSSACAIASHGQPGATGAGAVGTAAGLTPRAAQVAGPTTPSGSSRRAFWKA